MVLVGFLGCVKLIILWMIVGLEDIIGGEVCIGDMVVNNLFLGKCFIVMVF